MNKLTVGDKVKLGLLFAFILVLGIGLSVANYQAKEMVSKKPIINRTIVLYSIDGKLTSPDKENVISVKEGSIVYVSGDVLQRNSKDRVQITSTNIKWARGGLSTVPYYFLVKPDSKGEVVITIQDAESNDIIKRFTVKSLPPCNCAN